MKFKMVIIEGDINSHGYAFHDYHFFAREGESVVSFDFMVRAGNQSCLVEDITIISSNRAGRKRACDFFQGRMPLGLRGDAHLIVKLGEEVLRFLSQNFAGVTTFIQPSDLRRGRIYVRYLCKLGYKLTYNEHGIRVTL